MAGGHGPRVASAGVDVANSEHDAAGRRTSRSQSGSHSPRDELAQGLPRRHSSALFPAALDLRFLWDEAEPDGIGGGGGLCDPLAEPEAATKACELSGGSRRDHEKKRERGEREEP